VSVDDGFDISAAGLRADSTEVSLSVEVLATKLEETLPGRCRVERKGKGFRPKIKHVTSLEVSAGPWRFSVAVDGARVQAFREKEVGGISIKREPLDMSDWLAALTEELRAESDRSAESRAALTRLLY
jgi:hypothetical protein